MALDEEDVFSQLPLPLNPRQDIEFILANPAGKEEMARRRKMLEWMGSPEMNQRMLDHAQRAGRLIAEKTEAAILGIQFVQCMRCRIEGKDSVRVPGHACACGGI